jgi:hypothetical protein
LPASQVVQHHEWSPSRKIDLATNMHGSTGPKPSASGFRNKVAKELEPEPKYVIMLTDKDGTIIDKSKPVGKLGLAKRVSSFTAGHAGQIARMVFKGKGPRIKVDRIQ